MADFSVMATDLRAGGLFVGQRAAEARAAMADVGAEVQALLASGWHGQAADGFAAGWSRWRSGALDVVEALDAMGRLLDTTGREYAGVEAEVTSTAITIGRGLE